MKITHTVKLTIKLLFKNMKHSFISDFSLFSFLINQRFMLLFESLGSVRFSMQNRL